MEARLFVQTDSRTGLRFIFESRLAWNAGRNGEDWVELDKRSELPTGGYSLAVEYSYKGEIVSSGYKLQVKVTDTRDGKRLSLKTRGY